jgi:hypothetical protein
MKTECNLPIEGERRMVNETCRWLRRLNPDEGPTSQSDRPMVNQKISRWIGRRQYSRRYARWKARWRRVNPRLTAGQESVFRRSLTLSESFSIF